VKTVFVQVGNSDDKLSQRLWEQLQYAVMGAVRNFAAQIYGEWFSLPTSGYQNACFGFTILPTNEKALRNVLQRLTTNFRQESIAWNETGTTEFIRPKEPNDT